MRCENYERRFCTLLLPVVLLCHCPQPDRLVVIITALTKFNHIINSSLALPQGDYADQKLWKRQDLSLGQLTIEHGEAMMRSHRLVRDGVEMDHKIIDSVASGKREPEVREAHWFRTDSTDHGPWCAEFVESRFPNPKQNNKEEKSKQKRKRKREVKSTRRRRRARRRRRSWMKLQKKKGDDEREDEKEKWKTKKYSSPKS